MNSNLLFDFSVNKERKTIQIKRQFDANIDLVWQAWTTPELLDQWWAPRPYHIETKSLDFRVGGIWLYAMVSPEGEKNWCKADYQLIEAKKLFSFLSAFSDEIGNTNTEMPCSVWTNVFSENDGITKVEITLQHEKLEDIEMLIEMGFKEGLGMAFTNLDEIFATSK